MRSLLLALLLFISPFTFAKDATGKIEEIQICGTGANGWVRALQFKIGGEWFSIMADYYNSSGTDLDQNLASSMLLMAYSQNLVVSIRASDSWDSTHSACQATNEGKSGGVFSTKAGDYIRIIR